MGSKLINRILNSAVIKFFSVVVNLKHIGDVIVKAQFKGEITSYKLREKDCEKKLNLSLPFFYLPSFCLHSANTRKFISDLFVLFMS